MSDLLKAKTVVVTGASSAIGRAIALKAAEHGAKAVIISDVTETPREGGEPTVDEIKKLGVQSLFVKTDVSKRAENDALIEVADAFGGVDVMVANTGITLKADGRCRRDRGRLSPFDVGQSRRCAVWCPGGYPQAGPADYPILSVKAGSDGRTV